MAKQSTIVLLDMAPIHYAAELCAKVKTNMPDLHLIFVPNGCTAWCQPLDIAYMRSFKAHLSSTATRAYASEIMQGLDLQGRILKKPDLRIQLISFIAWAHLRVSDDEWATVLEEATACSDAGTLWEEPPCCAVNPPEYVCEEDADDSCEDADDACEPELADDEGEPHVAGA